MARPTWQRKERRVRRLLDAEAAHLCDLVVTSMPKRADHLVDPGQLGGGDVQTAGSRSNFAAPDGPVVVRPARESKRELKRAEVEHVDARQPEPGEVNVDRTAGRDQSRQRLQPVSSPGADAHGLGPLEGGSCREFESCSQGSRTARTRRPGSSSYRKARGDVLALWRRRNRTML